MKTKPKKPQSFFCNFDGNELVVSFSEEMDGEVYTYLAIGDDGNDQSRQVQLTDDDVAELIECLMSRNR